MILTRERTLSTKHGFLSIDLGVGIGISWGNRPYAYDVTEGRPRVLGVKRGTVVCAIAKHAASGPTPACHTAGPARACAPTESQHSFSTARARSATSLDPQHDVVVMEMWRQCIRSIQMKGQDSWKRFNMDLCGLWYKKASWTLEVQWWISTHDLLQWNLVITRFLGPWKLPCYIRFLIISG